MFTLDQIKAAHSKVKTGADFPNYIKDIKQLGVETYSTFVADGHTEYKGKNNFQISTTAKYDAKAVAKQCNPNQFKSDLKLHQQGKTDFASFINSCVACGVEKWTTDVLKMTCTYFDKLGNVVLLEQIPG